MFFRYSHLNRLRESRYLTEDGEDEATSADTGNAGAQGDNQQQQSEQPKQPGEQKTEEKPKDTQNKDKELVDGSILTGEEYHIVFKDLSEFSNSDNYNTYIQNYLDGKGYISTQSGQLVNNIATDPTFLLYYMLLNGKCSYKAMNGKVYSESWANAAVYSVSKKSGKYAYEPTQNTFLEFLNQIAKGAEADAVLKASGNQDTFNTLADLCLKGTINVNNGALMALFGHTRLYRCNDCKNVWENVSELFSNKASYSYPENVINDANEGKLNQEILDCGSDTDMLNKLNGYKQDREAQYNNSKAIDGKDKQQINKVKDGVTKLVQTNKVKDSIDAILKLATDKPDKFAELVTNAGLKEVEATHMDASVLGKLVTAYERNKNKYSV